jgi:cation transport regulator ChaC
MGLYFAYGSCMNLKDIARTVDAEFVGPATLYDYRIGFTRYSPKRKGGVADIVPAPGEKMEGVLFKVSSFKELDIREGAPFAYKRCKVKVQPKGSKDLIEVTTYTVVNKAETEFTPHENYLNLILNGAKQLSPEYQEQLKLKFKKFLNK